MKKLLLGITIAVILLTALVIGLNQLLQPPAQPPFLPQEYVLEHDNGNKNDDYSSIYRYTSDNKKELVYQYSESKGYISRSLPSPNNHYLLLEIVNKPTGQNTDFSDFTVEYFLYDTESHNTIKVNTESYCFPEKWSPDNSQIVFSRGDGTVALLIYNVKTNSFDKLDSFLTNEFPPAQFIDELDWSPDSKQLVLRLSTGYDKDSLEFIAILDLNTRQITQITNTVKRSYFPSIYWTQNNKITYEYLEQPQVFHQNDSDPYLRKIIQINPDGTDQQVILENKYQVDNDAVMLYASNWVISPDGKTLILSEGSIEDKPYQYPLHLFTYDVATGKSTGNFMEFPDGYRFPNFHWSTDSNQIGYLDEETGKFVVFDRP